MRLLASVVATVLAALSAAAAPTADLHGTVRVGSRLQAEAVVWLEARETPRAEPLKAVLSQRNLTFYPRVLAIRAGTSVEMPNDDRVFHNVFSFHDGTRFDLGLYPAGTSKRMTFERPGLSRIFCNIHPGMAAYVMAVDTPYFAVSDAQGRFSIPGAPAGAYTYHAWRAGSPALTGSATIDVNTPLDLQWP